MILLRRLVAIVLIPVFVLSLFVVVLLLRINSTALESTFWVEELRKAEVYDFAYDTILPAAVDEALASVDSDTVDVTQFADEIVRVAEELVPREWIQEQIETALVSAPPYFLGEADSFSLDISIRDRLDNAAVVAKRELRNEDVFGPLYDEAVAWAASRASDQISELPVDLAMTEAEAQAYIRRVLPSTWLQSNLDAFVDAGLPYATGQTDEFTVAIQFAERVDELAAVTKEILAKADTYDLVIDDVIIPIVESNLNQGVEVTSGVAFDQAEVLGVVRQVLDPEWASRVQTKLIDALTDFITGKSDQFSVEINLEDRRDAASNILVATANRQIEQRYRDLSECGAEDIGGLDLSANLVPVCRPPGLTYEELRAQSGISPSAIIATFLESVVPTSYSLKTDELRAVLGQGTWAMIEQVRGWVSTGFVLTEQDLLDRLNPGQIETFNDARAELADAVTLTEADILNRLSANDAATIDSGRRGIALARSAAPLAWVSIGLFLLVIGGLAGRNWGSRLAWAGFTLTFGAGLLWMATGPVYTSLSETAFARIQESISAEVTSPVGTLPIELALRVVRTISDDFVSGIASQAILLLTIGLAIIVGGVLLQALVRPRVTPPPIQTQ